MIPGAKIDFTKIVRKAQNTSEEVYHKYGKDYKIKDYIQEYSEGTRASEIVKKAEGLNNLPNIQEKMKDTGIVVDMNDDVFTLNRKIKLGNIAQRNLETLRKQQEELEALKKAEEVKEGE